MEIDEVVILRGEEELFARVGHLFTAATEVACAANDLYTWATSRPRRRITRAAAAQKAAGTRIRKIYRPAVLLDPSTARHLEDVRRAGASIRITPDELNETIILDRRVAILAGDTTAGERGYSVITRPETVHGLVSLYEAAWRGATELAVYDAQLAELRELAPRVLDLLTSGCKDETAARTLGLGVRTYRRRVAELMTALGATSRFQAGVRARKLGLV